ncbi:MAG: 30S ribosomal protein S17 [Myxococcales bacterium]|nr:30S ribosomal protein S17 [Myxococcales bacterium]
MSETTESTVATETAEAASRHRRQLTGVVVSTKGDKTAVVSVTRTFLHPQYRKYVRRSKRYLTHDEHNTCGDGDKVIIEECRPMSKRKRWRLRTVLRTNI